MLQCWNTEGIFRLIQSIPSPKAEPFKRWLARIGYERIQEIEDPELATKRTRALLPSAFFSGFIFPRETMPWIFYAIGSVLPTTYFIDLSRAIILRGATRSEFWSDLVILAGMGASLFTICAIRFRQKIA